MEKKITANTQVFISQELAEITMVSPHIGVVSMYNLSVSLSITSVYIYLSIYLPTIKTALYLSVHLSVTCLSSVWM